MDYIKIINDVFEKSKNSEPIEYSKNLNNAISYVKENVINTFFSTNKNIIDDITNKCNSKYVYRTMTEYETDTRSFLEDFRNTHMFKLLEFADATYQIENDDIVLESVQNRLELIKEANVRAKNSSIKRQSDNAKLANIINNVYTLLEFCEGNSSYSFYEDTINNIKDKKFYGTGDYEKCQKEYACLVLETCADAISSGLTQSINSLLHASKLCEIDELKYSNDRRKPKFQLF